MFFLQPSTGFLLCGQVQFSQLCDACRRIFESKVYFTTCFQRGRLNAVGLLLLSTRTNRWKPLHTFTCWSTFVSYCLVFINVPDYLHPSNFQSKMLAYFLFGLCVIYVPFCSPSQLNNSRRIVQVVKLLTMYFMFLITRNSFRH